jgi:hypothetical protein
MVCRSRVVFCRLLPRGQLCRALGTAENLRESTSQPTWCMLWQETCRSIDETAVEGRRCGEQVWFYRDVQLEEALSATRCRTMSNLKLQDYRRPLQVCTPMPVPPDDTVYLKCLLVGSAFCALSCLCPPAARRLSSLCLLPFSGRHVRAIWSHGGCPGGPGAAASADSDVCVLRTTCRSRPHGLRSDSRSCAAHRIIARSVFRFVLGSTVESDTHLMCFGYPTPRIFHVV